MSGLAVAVDHAGRVDERVHLVDRKALIVISAVCASIGGISFRHHTRSIHAGSRAKGEQSYGSFGRIRIIFGSAAEIRAPEPATSRRPTFNKERGHTWSRVRTCPCTIKQEFHRDHDALVLLIARITLGSLLRKILFPRNATAAASKILLQAC